MSRNFNYVFCQRLTLCNDTRNALIAFNSLAPGLVALPIDDKNYFMLYTCLQIQRATDAGLFCLFICSSETFRALLINLNANNIVSFERESAKEQTHYKYRPESGGVGARYFREIN